MGWSRKSINEKHMWKNACGLWKNDLCTTFRNKPVGILTVAQWVKNPTAVAQVAVEAQVGSLAQHSGLIDPVSLQLRWRPWPGNFHMPRCGHIKGGGVPIYFQIKIPLMQISREKWVFSSTKTMITFTIIYFFLVTVVKWYMLPLWKHLIDTHYLPENINYSL